MTNDDRWNAVDDFFAERLSVRDDALDAALSANAAAGLPPIDVSPLQGRLLQMMARMQGARRILEIGALGGYSTICMARALPEGGGLITLELDPRHASVARGNLERAGVSDRVEIRTGEARDSLAAMIEEQVEPFDFVFIDADKANIPHYLKQSLRLARPGATIIVDNVVRGGAVTDAASRDASVRGVRQAFEWIAAEPRLEATAIQTVGVKGWDGLLIAQVLA